MALQSPAPSHGILSLKTLLSTLTVTLHPSTFVFLTLPPNTPTPPGLEIQMTFQEQEGLTIIATQDSVTTVLPSLASQGPHPSALEYTFPTRMLTLNVHSSLEAVGFMAVVASKLAESGMAVNPVSGYFHDHLFVPLGREEEALALLERLADEARSEP